MAVLSRASSALVADGSIMYGLVLIIGCIALEVRRRKHLGLHVGMVHRYTCAHCGLRWEQGEW
jgi:hypothetical protein